MVHHCHLKSNGDAQAKAEAEERWVTRLFLGRHNTHTYSPQIYGVSGRSKHGFYPSPVCVSMDLLELPYSNVGKKLRRGELTLRHLHPQSPPQTDLFLCSSFSLPPVGGSDTVQTLYMLAQVTDICQTLSYFIRVLPHQRAELKLHPRLEAPARLLFCLTQ